MSLRENLSISTHLSSWALILFEKLGLPFCEEDEDGFILRLPIFLEKLRTYDPIVGQILEYRQLTKLKSTYADGHGRLYPAG